MEQLQKKKKKKKKKMKKIVIGMETNRAKFFDIWILVQTANQYYFLKKVLLGGL